MTATTLKILDVQPEDIEAFEFTFFDEWTDRITDRTVAALWSHSLGITFDEETSDDIYAVADVVAEDPRYAVYVGQGFIEIYRVADLPADVEYESA